MNKTQIRYVPVKRGLDLLLSAVALVLLSPVFILVTIAILLDSKGPVFFKQRRIGINNSEFHIIKFRSMRTDAPKEEPTDRFNNAESWITTTGKFLRKTSIDELPQLINIIKGEMSIVGPRPSLWNQHNLNKLRTQANVHIIKPGLTGWAQVNGRDENDDEEKVYWDTEYAHQFNLLFDLNCILKTIKSVISRKGVIEGGKKNQYVDN